MKKRSWISSTAVMALLTAACFAPMTTAIAQCTAPPTIVIQPTSQTVLADGAVTFSVRATFSSACPSTYNWQVRFPPGPEFFNLSGGYPDLLIQSPRGMNGAELRCVVSNAAG